MSRPSTISKLAEFAPDQWGLVTRRQAEGAGVSRATMTRLATDGSVLERVGHGVYHLTCAPMPDQLALRVAWLQLAPEAPAGRRTAAQAACSSALATGSPVAGLRVQVRTWCAAETTARRYRHHPRPRPVSRDCRARLRQP